MRIKLENTRQAESNVERAEEKAALNNLRYRDANVHFYNSFFSVAPTIQELKSSGVVLGGNGLIRCEGAGVPAPVFEWYKGERK